MYINKLADALEAQQADFVDILIRESGKAAQTADTEMMYAIGHIRHTATHLRLPDEVVEDTPERSAVIKWKPLGVCCAIVPWNWPLLLGVGKIGPAILAGNTLIVKPSPFAPYTLLKLIEAAAGIFPPGVLQILSGDDGLGPMLTAHPDIVKISFTGSTATGKKVMETCAKTLKRVTLELGGNDAAIVCEDADLSKVVPKVSVLTFLGSGQICMNIKRIYVHDKIYDQFLKAMVEFVKGNVKSGPAMEPGVLVGPSQNQMQFNKVKEMLGEAEKQGWTVALGGDANSSAEKKGFFLPPTIIDNPPDDSRIVVEEPFGPIVPVLRWSDEEDVVRRANDTLSGLGASVWSGDVARAQRMADGLEAGSVWVNTHFELGPHMPFGGHKNSGIGMEWGTVGLKGWCNGQSFWTRKD